MPISADTMEVIREVARQTAELTVAMSVPIAIEKHVATCKWAMHAEQVHSEMYGVPGQEGSGIRALVHRNTEVIKGHTETLDNHHGRIVTLELAPMRAVIGRRDWVLGMLALLVSGAVVSIGTLALEHLLGKH